MKYLRRRARTGPDGPWRIVILVRRIDVAVVASLLAHVLLFAWLPGAQPKPSASAAAPPMQVVIASPTVTVVTPPEEPQREAKPRPVDKPVPRPPTVSRPRPDAPPTPRPDAVPAETPVPRPSQPPAVDMMAAIEARRASRRASEAGRNAPPAPQAEDAASRNLKTLTGGEGVGGVFEILEKGTRRATFAFNGWKPEARGKWRTVIEVDAGLGGDVEIAIVRRMILLIREYYSGDFKWESHRLDRVLTLSARVEDSPGLEDFMMREFFGPPGPSARRR